MSANIPTHGFGGGGANEVVHGFGGGGGVENPPIIVPTRGLISGGDAFTIVGVSLSNLAYVDTFSGVSLDLSKWSDISSGGGSVSVNNGLRLDVPSTGGIAGIQTIASYRNFDVSARFAYQNAIENLFPNAPITFLRLTARIDSNNDFSVAHVWDPLRGSSIKVTVTVGGSASTLLLDSVKSPNRSLRLVRYGGRIQAYVGGILLVDYRGWKDTAVMMEMVSSSAAVPLNLRTTVSEYAPVILVTFGDEIAPASQEVVDRVIGSTPSTKLPAFVEVQIHSIGATESLGANSFEYYAPLQLTISNNNNSIVIANDDTLRDSTPVLKGLRL